MPISPSLLEILRLSILPEHPSLNVDINRLWAFLRYSHCECVGRNLEANNGTAVMTLSGGIDSSLSLAMLREDYSGPVVAFTIAGSLDHPDVRHAALAANAFEATHLVLVPDQKRQDLFLKRVCNQVGTGFGSGAAAIFCLYDLMSSHGFRSVMAHDGIDELMGGYWDHRKHHHPEEALQKREQFEVHWKGLKSKHLDLIFGVADLVSITPEFPYLHPSVVQYISKIPLDQRTSRGESKIPLRALALQLGVPQEIISRRKRGFCDALDQQ